MNGAHTILQHLFETFKTPEFAQMARLEGKEHQNDWTRTTNKFDLFTFVMFSLEIVGMSMSRGIAKFFQNIIDIFKHNYPSKGALAAARNKFNPNAIYEVSSELYKATLYNASRAQRRKMQIKNYHVLAIDGTEKTLDNVEPNRENYGVSGVGDGKSKEKRLSTKQKQERKEREEARGDKPKKQPRGQANAQISVLKDVANNYILATFIQGCNCPERTAAMHLVRYLKDNYSLDKVIILFDRGYPSIELIYFLNKLGVYYLIRCNERNLEEEWRQVPPNGSKWINIRLSNRLDNVHDKELLAELKALGTFQARFTLHKTCKGETERLITNLPDKEFKNKDLFKLYGMRWGIETGYRTLKEDIMKKVLPGRTPHTIEVNLCFAIFLLNIGYLFAYFAKDKLQKDWEERHKGKDLSEIKIKSSSYIKENFLVLLDGLQSHFYRFMSTLHNPRLFKRECDWVTRNAIASGPVYSIPGRSFPRNNKERLAEAEKKKAEANQMAEIA